MGMAFLSTAWFAVACVCIYYVTVEYLHFDKPMKGLCTTTDEMDENLCFFAVGQVRGCCLCHAALALPATPYFRAAQYAYGIISMGQFGFGFFNFSQVQCVCARKTTRCAVFLAANTSSRRCVVGASRSVSG